MGLVLVVVYFIWEVECCCINNGHNFETDCVFLVFALNRMKLLCVECNLTKCFDNLTTFYYENKEEFTTNIHEVWQNCQQNIAYTKP